jgi:signal transduction histidine kinase
MRIIWLVVLLVAIGGQLARHGATVRIPGFGALAFVAGAWLGWPLARRAERVRLTLALLATLGCAAGAIAPWATVAVAAFAVVGIGAATTFRLAEAVTVSACGPVVLAIVVFADGRAAGVAAGGAAAALAGLIAGVGRRQSQEEHVRAAQLAVAREVHDVLAHTLSAVAVQLEAADAVLESSGDVARIRELLQRSRRLVTDGIDETRAAVRALRDEPVELVSRLAELVEGAPAELRVSGEPRPLPPKAGLALYRAAQEAITNARKHAPGAATRVALEFGATDTILRVWNAAAAAPAARGGGFGLQGMRERLELAGGTLAVGAVDDGWRVEARVPA